MTKLIYDSSRIQHFKVWSLQTKLAGKFIQRERFWNSTASQVLLTVDKWLVINP